MTNYPTKYYLLIFLIFHSIFFGFGIQQPRACHPTDREALLDFKRRITCDPSKLLGSWIPSKDCCTTWEGIECDPSTGRVLNLFCRGYYYDDGDSRVDTLMCGTLSPFLGNLSSLQLLDLTELKNVTGPIPSELGKLTNLREMSLASNHLMGPIPHNLFKKLTSLTYFDLSDNNISGSVPESIGNLSNLTFLHLTNNRLTGSIPPSIGNMKSLQYILLSNNDLSGPIPSSVGNLRRVEFLNLENNNISGNIPTSIGNMISLKLIYLSKNNFTGKIPPTLSRLEKVSNLDLSRNGLSGLIPPQLAKLRNLEYLDLSYNPLSPQAIPPWLQQLPLLREIRLGHTGLVGQLPDWPSSSSLYFLDLSGNSLTGKIPEGIFNIKDLIQFNVSSNRLSGKIPPHKFDYPASDFAGNPGLCGPPLAPCNN